jgi:transposase
MLPGNTTDAIVLLPVVDRLRERFHIGRVCVVADRGMISAATIAALEERKVEYILGARERSTAVVRRLVLEDAQPLTPLLVDRARGETQLFVKEVKLGAARYILCRNELRRHLYSDVPMGKGFHFLVVIEAEAERATSGRRSSPGSANSSRAATKR